MNSGGTLLKIWIKRSKYGPMELRADCRLVAGRGLVGNANQGGLRQVTLLEAEKWDAVMSELGAQLDPSTRRANLLLGGIDLEESRGKILRIGECRFLIHGETRPCERMDEAFAGLREVMKSAWRGGAFAEVLDDSTIHVGDPVAWMDAAR